jgi:hypothetical protein
MGSAARSSATMMSNDFFTLVLLWAFCPYRSIQSAETFAFAGWFLFVALLSLFLIEELVEMLFGGFDVFRIMVAVLRLFAVRAGVGVKLFAVMVRDKVLMTLFGLSLGRMNQGVAVRFVLNTFALVNGVESAVAMRMNLHMVAVTFILVSLIAVGTVLLPCGLRVHLR